MDTNPGDLLIKELLEAPYRFDDEGKTYSLLQECFHGYPLNKLSPLLASSNIVVQQAAIWVASELGRDAVPLMDDVMPLVDHKDRYIKYHALEVVMICSFGEHLNKFLSIVFSLTSDDVVIRRLAMRLLANANKAQIMNAINMLEGKDAGQHSHHLMGLDALINAISYDEMQIVSMMNSDVSLIRKYGALVAEENCNRFPHLIKMAGSSSDSDISEFAYHLHGAIGFPRINDDEFFENSLTK
ncbi:hypothetical protein [Desulfatibacillum aliphaticivorans]|uniref:hypothetical protein n=1 Tax=Desulfatibacillum aliphaticivorans TaxID=218208 RepID=UPI0004832B8E|nr:hypothetical protein [Desulfatibacillum aliphaticivorans]